MALILTLDRVLSIKSDTCVPPASQSFEYSVTIGSKQYCVLVFTITQFVFVRLTVGRMDAVKYLIIISFYTAPPHVPPGLVLFHSANTAASHLYAV